MIKDLSLSPRPRSTFSTTGIKSVTYRTINRETGEVCMSIWCVVISLFVTSFSVMSQEEIMLEIDRNAFVDLQHYADNISNANAVPIDAPDVCTSISEVGIFKLPQKSNSWEQVKLGHSNDLVSLLTSTINAFKSKDTDLVKVLVSPEINSNQNIFNDAIDPFFEQLSVFKIKAVLGYVRYGKRLVFITNVEYKKTNHECTI